METLGKDDTQVESSETNDTQGNIRHRLRDRGLLRKRKAEAEERATYQWVHGVQSKRPRVTHDKKNPGKIGRPRKADPKAPAQPALVDVPPGPMSVEELAPPQAASLPEPTYQEPPSLPTFSPMPLLFAPVLIQPEVEIVPVLPEVERLGTEPKSSQLMEEVLIEDLGPDEQEDVPHPQENPLLDLGTNEELADNKQVSPTPKFILPTLEENLSSSVS